MILCEKYAMVEEKSVLLVTRWLDQHPEFPAAVAMFSQITGRKVKEVAKEYGGDGVDVYVPSGHDYQFSQLFARSLVKRWQTEHPFFDAAAKAVCDDEGPSQRQLELEYGGLGLSAEEERRVTAVPEMADEEAVEALEKARKFNQCQVIHIPVEKEPEKQRLNLWPWIILLIVVAG